MTDTELVNELNNMQLQSLISDEDLKYNKEIIKEISYRLLYYANKANDASASREMFKK